MKLVKVGAAVLNQTPMDWDRNAKNIVAAIAQAKAEGVTVLCLPEMCVSGYGCEDVFGSPDLQRTAMEILVEELLPLTEGIVACFGLPVMYQNGLFNAVATVANGKLLGFVCKRHLAGDGLHYEPRWFREWPAEVRGTVLVQGERVPIGDIHFDIGGVVVGYEICEDAWVALRPGAALAQRGVDIIMNPSASHFAFGKMDVRKGFVVEGSRAFGVTYLYTNLLGNEAGRAIYDGGALIASGGTLLATGPRFGFQHHHLTTAVVDIEKTRTVQSRTASFRPEMDGDESDRITAPFEWPDEAPAAEACALRSWEEKRLPDRDYEAFTRAVALALHDYRLKSRARGYVVSLSGGADSSACAILVSIALRLAGLADEAVADHLTCVYQGTRNSSVTTFEAARTVAESLGAEFHAFNIDALVQDYRSIVEDALERPLTWDTDDIALQNIQARVRGPGAWMLANIKNQILIATSNRSEAAVGYATMDGDTCGGISPIAGIDKDFLLRWLKWMEVEGIDEIGPIEGLEKVTALRPTAELRPSEMHQTDEDDLMPYPILDAIEETAIGDKKGPVNTWQVLTRRFPAYPPHVLGVWVDRFFRLWCRNQWKRERYAPAFHVDDKNLDPRTWCRFPILSGGYRRELAQLKALVAQTAAPEAADA